MSLDINIGNPVSKTINIINIDKQCTSQYYYYYKCLRRRRVNNVSVDLKKKLKYWAVPIPEKCEGSSPTDGNQSCT